MHIPNEYNKKKIIMKIKNGRYKVEVDRKSVENIIFAIFFVQVIE